MELLSRADPLLIRHPIRIALYRKSSSPFGSSGRVKGYLQWSIPCSGHMRWKLSRDPLRTSRVRVGASTGPLLYNPEQELAKLATPVPYSNLESSSDPASSSFLEFWPSLVFWTALMSCPDPGSVIAHVRIWLTVLYSSVAPRTSGSALAQGSSPNPDFFRIPPAWKSYWLTGPFIQLRGRN